MTKIETGVTLFVVHGEIRSGRSCDICGGDQARYIRSLDLKTGEVVSLNRCDDCTTQFGCAPLSEVKTELNKVFE